MFSLSRLPWSDPDAFSRTQQYFPRGWYAYQLAQLDDMDNDALPELAVLGAQFSNAVVKAQIRNPVTGSLIRNVSIQ
jgi:hypothetical protein